MASNDYYNENPYPNNYRPYNPPTPSGSAPPYTTHPPSRGNTQRTQRTHQSQDITSPVSPFEAPFDDHVYPLHSEPNQPYQQSRYDSQTTLGQDTQYYGQQSGNGRSHGANSYTDDIPLREQPAVPAKDDPNISTDHVYDADPAMQSARLEEGRKRNSLGGGGFGRFKGKGRIAWVTYLLTAIQVIVFIVEIIKNAQLTGSPIEIHPSFNPMIGPSPYVLINMGARYVPCMHTVDGIQTRVTGGAISWPCPNTNSVAECQLNNLCGFNMPASQNPVYPGQDIPLNQFKDAPDQWFRFILPIFLHAGIVHIGFNMLLQMTLGKEMEIAIGPIRYFLVYISSGIFGFVLGGNFAATGIASTGASGALFGILALNLLDLLYTWRERISPWKDFAFIMLDVVISFVLGLLPGLDNFSHIGGFLMGLVLGICILHSPNALRKRINDESTPYTPVSMSRKGEEDSGVGGFFKNPVGFFKGRKPAWWAWLFVRVAGLVFVFVVFILLLKNFYTYRTSCSWCKYLSCLNINNWCELGNLQLTQQTTKRGVLESWDEIARRMAQ